MAPLRIMAIVFGVAFILMGIAGFIPGITSDHLLFNLFMVDTAHNIIHVVSGIAALLAAMSVAYSVLYFKIFGVIYGVVTILGFITHDLIIIHVNTADNILHAFIALLALYLGFCYEKNAQAKR